MTEEEEEEWKPDIDNIYNDVHDLKRDMDKCPEEYPELERMADDLWDQVMFRRHMEHKKNEEGENDE